MDPIDAAILNVLDGEEYILIGPLAIALGMHGRNARDKVSRHCRSLEKVGYLESRLIRMGTRAFRAYRVKKDA